MQTSSIIFTVLFFFPTLWDISAAPIGEYNGRDITGSTAQSYRRPRTRRGGKEFTIFLICVASSIEFWNIHFRKLFRNPQPPCFTTIPPNPLTYWDISFRKLFRNPQPPRFTIITPNPLPYWNISFKTPSRPPSPSSPQTLSHTGTLASGNSPKKKTSRPASPSPPQALSDTTTTPATEIFTAADKEKYRLFTEWAKSPVSGKTERETDSDISVKGSELVLTDIFLLLAPANGLKLENRDPHPLVLAVSETWDKGDTMKACSLPLFPLPPQHLSRKGLVFAEWSDGKLTRLDIMNAFAKILPLVVGRQMNGVRFQVIRRKNGQKDTLAGFFSIQLSPYPPNL